MLAGASVVLCQLNFLLIPIRIELNPIERCWAQAKRYTRSHCNYIIAGLRKNIPDALDNVTAENMKNHFRKVRHYMFGYLQGCSGGPDLEKLEKKMKKQ